MTCKLFTTILSLVLLTGSAIAEETIKSEKSANSIVVDLVSGKIGDVAYRKPIAEIEKVIGPKRIKKTTEDLEGNDFNVYIIDINGHKLFKHWNSTSFTDPAFKIDLSLGTGVKIKDFRIKYGKGEVVNGEGDLHSLCFKSEKPKFGFCISIPWIENDSQLDGLTAGEIWIE